jgi:regulator of protease activity HflC (stomatin/prohibitin superfamily)
MLLFIFGLVLAVAAAVLFLVPGLFRVRAFGPLLGALCAVVAVIAVLFSSALVVGDNQGGLIMRNFGPDLPANRVVAANGEKGPQARVLGPGWHFGYWPWQYTVDPVECVTIDQGKVGVVVALDGRSLPEGVVYAPAWKAAEEMLDGERFLTNEGGFRGPQLTILTPGRYRYNPRLFSITPKAALVVGPGEVAVVKANVGAPAAVESGDNNGVRLVPRGSSGIWNEALGPGAYNLHPDAHQFIKVQTTQRVYVYQEKKWAIKVRSKDGFSFPVDVRVSVQVQADKAPYLVALLGDPDRHGKDQQEEEELQVLEAKVILPLVRAIFRNVAEGMNALQFVNSRSQVEQVATKQMRDELAKYQVACEGVFIGNIDLDETDAGKQLLATQTEREVAVNQQATFAEKKRAEESRANYIKAQEEAEQQRALAAATYQVRVREQQAQAREAEAKGEARYIEITAEARQRAYNALVAAIGQAGVVQLEVLKQVSEGKIGITPHVMVTGGGTSDALAGTILGNLNPAPAPAPAPKR